MNATGKWARRAVWGTLVAVMTIGCSPLTTIAFLFHRDDKLPAQFPLRPKDGPKKDKDAEITVLLICGQRPGGALPYEFTGIDRELTTVLAKRLPEEAKANKEKLTVITPSQFDRYKMKNPNWSRESAVVIGKQLGADYVLDIALS